MFEKLTETITKFQKNPMEALKGVIDDKKKLQSAVMTNRPSTKLLVEHLEKNYTKEQISDIIGGDGSLQDFIELKMSPSFGEHLLSEVTQPFTALQSVFEGSDIGSLIDEYASLFHKQPCDPKQIEEWMGHRMTSSIQPKKQNDINSDNVRSADDEEDVKDNKEYDYDFTKNSKSPDKINKYISLLPIFTSVGYLKDPKTGTTLCSRTAAEDAKKLYGLDWKEGNAFDVMRAKNKTFNTSIVSDLYKEKEGFVNINNKLCAREDMGQSEYINTLAGENNVVDLYVTSSTTKGKKYGHRATMFRIGDQRFVIDPYTAIQPGEQKNKPRTLESYALSMKTGNNKREFMRMDFYKSDTLDQKIASVSSASDNEKAAA